ncbi:hypothetical protein HN51_009354 [Arachis hypogaea]|uniref:Pectinesterase n=1 Tax=Arachis hypogaea TaxID=3818 RepID=A0A445CZN4_ARAHY|nr:putative pectinesterase 63 [Arachis hypogaea]QHO43856.1 Pectinesterase [Arachis hypogaea]RYR56389.1 hypothetical protein Ahy_A05g022101 [Arachis hypogaea]
MATKPRNSNTKVSLMVMVTIILTTSNVVLCDDKTPVPTDRGQLESWFNQNVGPLEQRKSTLDPALVAAEQGPKVVKVMQDGSGDFKTITDAVNSVPSGNAKRVIISIGAGNYNEKIKIERTKNFITFYGAPGGNLPTLSYGGTAQQYGTVDSATLIVESDYFVAANIQISNTAPRPDGKRPGAQAVALRISGDKAAFYNCKLLGFQDTICDDRHRHFFKNCLVQGTVDFIFGSGRSLYLNTELRVLGDSGMTVIVAQARTMDSQDTAFAFVHCDVTGTGTGSYLGRAWMSNPKVIFAYTTMTSVINPVGWSDNMHTEYDRTLYFGEYKNSGAGAAPAGRAKFSKQLSDAEAQPFLNLGFIDGSSWLLPPPRV